MKKSECESDKGMEECERAAQEALDRELEQYLVIDFYENGPNKKITCNYERTEILPEGQTCEKQVLTAEEKQRLINLYVCNCPKTIQDAAGAQCGSGMNPFGDPYKTDSFALLDVVDRMSTDLCGEVNAAEKSYYPLYHAKLTFTAADGEKYVTTSDEYGKFTFDLDKGKTYTVKVEKEGYKTLETDFMAVEDINYNLRLVVDSGDSQQYGGFADITEVSGTQNLVKGWNLISLNVAPDRADYMASDLISDINSQGLFVTRVMRYRDGVWQVYRHEADDASDFRLKLGEGYVLKSDSKGEFSIRGKGLSSTVPVQLSTGWNLVGIPYSDSEYTAVGIIDAANVSHASVDTVSKWDSKWINVVKTEGIVYGHDFKVERNRAYFIRNTSAIYWEP
jgi:hypothetical protein